MYKSVGKLSIVKGSLIDRIFFPPGAINWLQSLGVRNNSGLNKEKSEELSDLPETETFTSFLHHRQEQAKRSIIVQMPDFSSWENVINLCSQYASVNKVYQYATNTYNYLLIEMKTAHHYQKFVDSINIHSTNHGCGNFLVFSNLVGTSNRGVTRDILEKVLLKVPTHLNSDALKSALSHDESFDELVYRIYNSMKLSDFGLRLRFLTCRQMELIFSGFSPNFKIYPFGSSVTGLGQNGCDLDMCAINNSSSKGLFSLPCSKSTSDKTEIINRLEALHKVLLYFRNDISNVNYVKKARVPIIKFKNRFTSVDCDLSMANPSTIAVAQVLFTLTNLDERLRPFIFLIKVWAKKLGIVSKIPSQSFSSFSITLLTVFFLQQNKLHNLLLPPLSTFLPKTFSLLNDEDIFVKLNGKKKKLENSNTSLEQLLRLFFEFYSQFDFQNYGISVRNGVCFTKTKTIPTLIENPLDPTLNVSQNVIPCEVKQFQGFCKKASSILNQSSTAKIKLHKLFQLDLIIDKRKVFSKELFQ